jgi:transaldolase/glucose-6-phosphate isomerase
VASKSGSTLEPNVMKDYFYARVKELVSEPAAGNRFIAITDPGSKLETIAMKERFRHVFYGIPAIGGRFSALSNFGMVPAALSGMDVGEFLHRSHEMVVACSACPPVERNPGVVLGLVLGTLANRNRDKLTLVCSPRIHDLGAWLEQLLAESTGKEGKAIIPVDREPLGSPKIYGGDRLFVYLRLETEPDAKQDEAVDALEQAGHPVVRITLRDTYDLGQEMFRWEIATAVAGAVMGVNPFNQPDVEASKVATRALTEEYEKAGAFPAEEPLFAGNGVQLFTNAANTEALNGTAAKKSLAGFVKAHLDRLGAGDYCGLLAYVEMNEAHESALQRTRERILNSKRVATCLGFGPRFLHSTGQAYKGGPNSGVFVQITSDPAEDLPIPGRKSTFGAVITAQARGDFQVLAERGRRVLRVLLGSDVAAGLEALDAAVAEALS